MKILFYVSMFTGQREIQQKIKEEFGENISFTTIQYYKNHPDYQRTILKFRERWNCEILDVELANKRRRLEELERIYYHCVKTNQMKNALASLYQVQHEVEKEINNLTMNNYQVNVYKDMTETELEQERLKSLERIKVLKGALPCPAVEKRNENQENKE